MERKATPNKKKRPKLFMLAVKGMVVLIVVVMFLISRVFGVEAAQDQMETEARLDTKIRNTALRIQEMIVLKDLPEIKFFPARASVQIVHEPNCIEYDTFSFGDTVGSAGSPSKGYFLKSMKLCFKGAKLLSIESVFIEASLKRAELNQIRLVHTDPTTQEPNLMVMETSLNRNRNQSLKLGDLENSKANGHRTIFKRDFYVPYLINLEYHLRATYDMHRKLASHRNRDAINFLRRRGLN